jgi:hypothetical protein
VLSAALVEGVLARDAVLLGLVAAWVQLMLVVELSVLGHVLELPKQKARGFLVLIVLRRLFPKHAYKVFDEIPVKT